MLMMDGGLPALIRFCTAIKPPNVVPESAHAAITMAALGAAALAHSASKIASASFGGITPGLRQLLPGCTCEKEPEV
jgi:hypothetical protein